MGLEWHEGEWELIFTQFTFFLDKPFLWTSIYLKLNDRSSCNNCICGSVHYVTVTASNSTWNIVGLLQYYIIFVAQIFGKSSLPSYIFSYAVLSFLLPQHAQAEGTPSFLSVMVCGISSWLSHIVCFLQWCASEKLFFSLYIVLLGWSHATKKSFLSWVWPSLCFLSQSSFTLSLPLTHLCKTFH